MCKSTVFSQRVDPSPRLMLPTHYPTQAQPSVAIDSIPPEGKYMASTIYTFPTWLTRAAWRLLQSNFELSNFDMMSKEKVQGSRRFRNGPLRRKEPLHTCCSFRAEAPKGPGVVTVAPATESEINEITASAPGTFSTERVVRLCFVCMASTAGAFLSAWLETAYRGETSLRTHMSQNIFVVFKVCWALYFLLKPACGVFLE